MTRSRGRITRTRYAISLRQIARRCSIDLGTVHKYLQRAEAAGVRWPLGEYGDEDRVKAALFGAHQGLV